MTVDEAPRDKTDLLSAAEAAPEEIYPPPSAPMADHRVQRYLHYEDFAPSLRVRLEGPQR